MPLATMTTKGQMTIPKAVREKLHLKPHDRLVVIPDPDGERAILRPIHGDALRLKGIFKNAVKGPIDFKKLRQDAEEGMAQEALERSEIRTRFPQ